MLERAKLELIKSIDESSDKKDSTFADEREELRFILTMDPLAFDKMVRKRFNTPQELVQLTTALTQFENTDYKNWPEDYQKFRTLSADWFKNEKQFYSPALSVYKEFDLGGQTEKAEFLHEPPSITYPPLFAEIYKALGGRLDISVDEFARSSKKILQGFHGLEFGCGPGFGLKVLKDLGADVSGVDKENFAAQPKGLNIMHSDILNVGKYRGRLKHKPNVVYSLDLVEGEIFDSADEAGKIIEAGNALLDSGGLQIHMVPCVKLSRRIIGLYRRLLKMEKEGKMKLYAPMQAKEEWEKGNAMSRDLILKNEDVEALAERLGMKILKNEQSKSHWVLWLEKK